MQTDGRHARRRDRAREKERRHRDATLPSSSWMRDRPEWLKRLVLGMLAMLLVVGAVLVVTRPTWLVARLDDWRSTPGAPAEPLRKVTYGLTSHSELPVGMTLPDQVAITYSDGYAEVSTPCMIHEYTLSISDGRINVEGERTRAQPCPQTLDDFEAWFARRIHDQPRRVVTGDRLELMWDDAKGRERLVLTRFGK